VITLYLDESKSKGYTIVTAAIVPANAAVLRKELDKLRKKGQSRLHFVKESDSRRRQIISTLIELGFTARIYHIAGVKEAVGREACLAAIVNDAVEHGVTRLVLERDDSIEKFDRKILAREIHVRGLTQTVNYAHDTASSEPLLWVPDAIAWSFARGGEWNSRIQPLLASVTQLQR
jgi:hypothetical protein